MFDLTIMLLDLMKMYGKILFISKTILFMFLKKTKETWRSVESFWKKNST